MAATLEPRERGGPIQKYWEEASTISQLGNLIFQRYVTINEYKYYKYFPIVYFLNEN